MKNIKQSHFRPAGFQFGILLCAFALAALRGGARAGEPTPTPTPEPPPPVVQFSTAEIHTCSGGYVSAEVQIDTVGLAISGGQIRIVFDPALVHFNANGIVELSSPFDLNPSPTYGDGFVDIFFSKGGAAVAYAGTIARASFSIASAPPTIDLGFDAVATQFNPGTSPLGAIQFRGVSVVNLLEPTPPDPTPYPTLTPPQAAEEIVPMPTAGGPVVFVDAGESIQAAVDGAGPGTRILLNADRFEESVTVHTSGLLIEAAAGRSVTWTGDRLDCDNYLCDHYGQGSTALRVEGVVSIVLRNLRIEGGPGSGPTYGGLPLGLPGGPGGPAIVTTDSSIYALASTIIGGLGGNGEGTDNLSCGYASGGAGGNAATSIKAYVSAIHSDLNSRFLAGIKGYGSGPLYLAEYGCCATGVPDGYPAPPLFLDAGSLFAWTEFTGVLPTPTPGGDSGRYVADYDDSGCTDLGDFLYVIDNWQMVPPGGGDPITLADFLVLLDFWSVGPNCP